MNRGNESSAKKASSIGGKRLGLIDNGTKNVDTVATGSTWMPRSDFTGWKVAGRSKNTPRHWSQGLKKKKGFYEKVRP